LVRSDEEIFRVKRAVADYAYIRIVTAWKLQSLCSEETKIVVFQSSGTLRKNEIWRLQAEETETINYIKYCGIFAQGKNFEASRDSRC
jgi:hypothetical protein